MKPRSWTDQQLVKAVADSASMAAVLRALHLKDNAGGAHAHVKARIIALALDTTHFTGQTWNKGKQTGIAPPNKRDLSSILVEKSTYKNGPSLKRRLLKDGLLTNKCAVCGQPPVWEGKLLIMRLDHINGVRTDNRISNLRIICPNCDSQTPTFTGRNTQKARLNRENKAKAAKDATSRPPNISP